MKENLMIENLEKFKDTKNYEGFLFLPSFRESIERLREAGQMEMADELLEAIIVYGTEKKEIATNPAVDAMMIGIIRTIDAGKARRVVKENSK